MPRNVPLMPFDKRYMKQALLNLVKNALAAMPSGGTLTLSTELSGDELRIAVADTGIGIPEDKIGKIFEPYFTTKENGTGLGLTLTYKIVKEHGGEMTRPVQARPGFRLHHQPAHPAEGAPHDYRRRLRP